MSRYYNNMDNDRCEFLEIPIEGATAYVEPISTFSNGDSGFIASSPLYLFSIALCLRMGKSGDGSDTPLSAHCPGAPMKLSRLLRNIVSGFQRKLF
ncbi:hypothetical protein Bca4012_038304 [Brassica carinata]|uniref:Uncharacterized protein n=1 Tax=Brassica carinata TaxID=52824 RepID=A0A8X8B4Q6_BRACI|nr:hypothetical protein Bca52824_006692 [Brassica carinata]